MRGTLPKIITAKIQAVSSGVGQRTRPERTENVLFFGYFGSLLWFSGKVEIYNQQVDIDKVAISKSLTSSEGDYNTAYSNIQS